MKLSRVNDQYLSGYPAFDPPVVALGVLLELLLDHTDHDLVADEATLVHDLLGGFTQVGLPRDLVSEHVTGCQMADTVLARDVRCLCSLAYTRTSIKEIKDGLEHLPAPGGPMRTSRGASPDPVAAPMVSLTLCRAPLAEDTADPSSWLILPCSYTKVSGPDLQQQ